jgi:hypothetical protein
MTEGTGTEESETTGMEETEITGTEGTEITGTEGTEITGQAQHGGAETRSILVGEFHSVASGRSDAGARGSHSRLQRYNA